MTLEDQIKTLTARNIEILFLLCEKKTEKEIGVILVIREKAVQNHLTRIYEYLGWKELSNEEKEFKLRSEICPIVKKYIKKREDVNDWIKHPKKKTATTEEVLPPEPTIPESEPEPEPEPTKPEPESESEPELEPEPEPLTEPLKVRSESETTTTPLPPVSGTYETPPPPRRAPPRRAPRNRLWIFAGIIVVILLCLVVSRNSGVLGIASLQSPTPTRTKIPTAVRTPRPTKTEGPSPTPTDTPTPTIPPTPFPLPFVDNFEDGYNPAWRIIGNEPFVVKGSLTADLSSSDENWVFIGDNSWRNYQVETSISFYNCPPCAVGVRVSGVNSMIAINFHYLDQPRMSIVSSDGWQEIPETRNLWTLGDEFFFITMRVEDDKITSYINSELQSEVTLPPSKAEELETGGVGLLLGPGMKVDYIKISPLP